MNKVLRKRIPRDLKNSLLRNLALLVMIVLGMYLVISMIGGAETIIAGTEQNCRDKNCEDGEFTVFLPLTDEQIAELDKAGAEVEAKFSMDIESGKNKILRVMKNRTDINLMTLDDGELADKICAAADGVGGIRCVKGKIASGDCFVNSAEKKKYISETFGAIACEMEGAAIGHVCYVNKVPFCVIRAISDAADGSSHMDYSKFTALAAKNSAAVMTELLRSGK